MSFMNVKKSVSNDQTVLALSGRLDTLTAPGFQQTLLTAIAEGRDVVIDLAQVAYVSSAGLRALLIGQKSVSKHKRQMILRHVASEIMDVFDLTGFSSILTIE